MGLFLVLYLVPKLVQIRVHFLIGFGAPVWLQNVAQTGYKAPQKASRRHRSTPRRALSGCASAVLVLYEKSCKNIVFYHGFSASKLSKTTPKEPKDAHEAILYAQKRPRRQHKSHSDSEFRNGPEKDPKKTQKRMPETSPKRARIEVRKRVRK